MASRFRILAIAALSFGIVAPALARADTITVTSGTATVPWDDAAWFSFKGDGLLLSGLFSSVAVSPQGTCFLGCAPGVSIDLTSVFGGQPGYNLGQSQAAVVNSVTYADPGHFDTWLRLSGQLSFDAEKVMTPPLLAADAEDRAVHLAAPFLFSGQVAGFRDGADGPLFNVDLTGRGTATLRLIDDGSGSWRYPEVTFSFEQPLATPEPGSLVLLATGVAGLLFRVRRNAP